MFEIMHAYLPKLKVMDMANCFITNKSIDVINAMVELERPKLDILLLQGNLLLSSAVDNLRVVSEARKLKIALQDDPYEGIEEPLMYDVEKDGYRRPFSAGATTAGVGATPTTNSSKQEEEAGGQGTTRRKAKGYVPDQQYRKRNTTIVVKK